MWDFSVGRGHPARDPCGPVASLRWFRGSHVEVSTLRSLPRVAAPAAHGRRRSRPHRPGATPETAAKHSPLPAVTKQTPALTAASEARSTGGLAALLSASRGSPSRRSSSGRPARRSTAATADEPRLEQFPSPRPLSTQDKLLLLYLRETPQEEVLSAASSAESLDDLQIKDLTVAPMDAPAAVPKSSVQN